MESNFEFRLAQAYFRHKHQRWGSPGRSPGLVPTAFQFTSAEFEFASHLIASCLAWVKEDQAVLAVATRSSRIHIFQVTDSFPHVSDSNCLKMSALGSTWVNCDIDVRTTSQGAGPSSVLALTAGSDGSVRLWNASPSLDGHLSSDVRTTPLVHPIHQGKVSRAKFIPLVDAFVSIGVDSTIALTDTNTSEKITTYTAHSDPLSAISLHPHSPLAAVGEDSGLVVVWDFRCRKYICDFNRDLDKDVYAENSLNRPIFKDKHGSKVTALNWDSTGILLASGSEDGLLKVWDLRKQSLVKSIPGHTARLCEVGFWGSDSHRLLSASIDGDVRVWDWYSQLPLAHLKTASPKLTSLKVDYGVPRFFATFFDKTLHVYDSHTPNLGG
jgi:WD40 repeat protein